MRAAIARNWHIAAGAMVGSLIGVAIAAVTAQARLPSDEVPVVRHYAPTWLLGNQPDMPQRFVRQAQRDAVARIVVDEARAQGVPVELALAVAHVESGMRPAHAVTGPATRYGRAVGTMQVLPSTGRAMGCGNLRDTRQNVRCGVRYLRQSLDRHGDAGLAALEFHGGPNRRLWGPRTQRYRQMVLARMGRGSAAAPARTAAAGNEHFTAWWLSR